jgi:hypothetical protein
LRDRPAIDRGGDGAAHAHVVEWRMADVERDSGDQPQRHRAVAQRRPIGELGLLDGRDQVPIDRTAPQEREVRLRIGHDANVQAPDPRPAARHRRVGEPVAALPGDQPERPVPHRRGVERGMDEIAFPAQHVLGQDELLRRAVGEERVDRRRPRFPKAHAHRVLVERDGRSDAVVALARPHRIARVEDRVDRPDDVARGDRHAVFPARRAQVIHDRGPVAREIAVRNGRDTVHEDGDLASARVHVDKRQKDQPGELALDVVGIGMGKERIERGRVRGDVETHGRRISRAGRGRTARGRPGNERNGENA